jgi:hypothetical protein
MWHDMFVMGTPVLEKVLRTVLVYSLILILFRVAGKRDLASLSTFDFVVIFLLSNVVQNAVIGKDDSLLGGAVGAVTLVALNAVLNRWVAASDRASRLLEGTATTVIEDGRVLSTTLRRLALRSSALEHAVRIRAERQQGRYRRTARAARRPRCRSRLRDPTTPQVLSSAAVEPGDAAPAIPTWKPVRGSDPAASSGAPAAAA